MTGWKMEFKSVGYHEAVEELKKRKYRQKNEGVMKAKNLRILKKLRLEILNEINMNNVCVGSTLFNKKQDWNEMLHEVIKEEMEHCPTCGAPVGNDGIYDERLG